MGRLRRSAPARWATILGACALLLSACAHDDLTQGDADQGADRPDLDTRADQRPDLPPDQGVGADLARPDQGQTDQGQPQDLGTPDAPPDEGQPQDMAPDLGPPDLEQLSEVGTPERPARALLPPGYDHKRPMPLILLLHGYGTTASYVDTLLGLSDEQDQTREFILLAPEGTRDLLTNRFWNATPSCCDYYASGVDDAAYLLGVLDRAMTQLKVDPDQVHVIGHSNGAFMANRLACDASERFASAVTMAGTGFGDAARCAPTTPLQLLHIHGTHDEVIPYLGTLTYPGAEPFVQRWVERQGCSEREQERLDLMGTFYQETLRSSWTCERGRVEFWRMDGVTHNPILSRRFAQRLLDQTLAARKTR